MINPSIKPSDIKGKVLFNVYLSQDLGGEIVVFDRDVWVNSQNFNQREFEVYIDEVVREAKKHLKDPGSKAHRKTQGWVRRELKPFLFWLIKKM